MPGIAYATRFSLGAARQMQSDNAAPYSQRDGAVLEPTLLLASVDTVIFRPTRAEQVGTLARRQRYQMVGIPVTLAIARLATLLILLTAEL